MPGSSSQDLFQQATDLFASRVNEYADGIAQRLGQPISGAQLSKDQVLERWNYSPLGDTQTADAHYHQLVALGTPPGQALDAVYPFRKMLFSGPDLKSQVQTATQIAGWDAEQKGVPPPQPDPHALPLMHLAQTMNNQQSPAPSLPAPAAGGPGLPGPASLGMPGPSPATAPAPGGMSPVPQQSPMPITPVPGVS